MERSHVGRYELRALLGDGGVGSVYAAFDTQLRRELAIEVVPPELSHSPRAEKLVEEARRLAKLSHPAVTTVYDVGRAKDGAVFIAMERVDGETVAAIVARTKLRWRRAVSLLARAGAGLAAAHAAGIVHGAFGLDRVVVERGRARVVVARFVGGSDAAEDIAAFRAALREAIAGPAPARLLRALDREWPDMPSLLAELAALRARRSRLWLAAGAAGLVGAGISGVLALRSDANPCDVDAPVVPAGLALDARTALRLDARVAMWRVTHAATCNASHTPTQPPAVATCLDARRTEIAAFTDEARRSGAKAGALVQFVIDPGRCANPPSGLLVARAPEDPKQRAAVADLRYRALEIEAELADDTASPTKAATALDADAATAWPLVRAETLLLLGRVQLADGDIKTGGATLRDAAAYADRVHHDSIAARAWTALVGQPSKRHEHGLEYARYADAALDRIGRPAELEVQLLTTRAEAMMDTDQLGPETEAVIRSALALSERVPAERAQAVKELASLLARQGRHAESVALLRTSIADPRVASNFTLHADLATSLAFGGHPKEAEAMARDALALAERTRPPLSGSRGRMRLVLAQVLDVIGKPAEALVEVRHASAMISAVYGDRSRIFGEAQTIEASLLVTTGDDAGAAKLLERACETLAFRAGETSSSYTECLINQANVLSNLERLDEALALCNRIVAILVDNVGAGNPRLINAYVMRGTVYANQGSTAGIADFELALEMMSKLQIDRGHIANAKSLLATLVWQTDRTRARALATEAVSIFEKAGEGWAVPKADTEKWLRSHR